MMSDLLRTLAMSLLTLSLVACSGVYVHPIPNTHQTVLSMDARKRVIVMTEKGGPTQNAKGEKQELRSVVCAEPSPDVFSALAANGAFTLGPKENPQTAQASFAQSVAAIARRTETTQLLRDGLYRACEAYMNGVIGRDEYRHILMGYDELLITLVALETLGRPEIPQGQQTGEQGTVTPSNKGPGNAAPEQSPSDKKNGGQPTANPQTAQQGGAGDSQPAKPKVTGSLTTSLELEPDAAKNIHDIVRDYYCFQLALKDIFYGDKKGKAPTQALTYLCGGNTSISDKDNPGGK